MPSKSIVAEPTQSASFSAQANAKVEGGNGVGGGFDAPAVQQASAPGVQTLEDTVARLLRPMLRQWLDDNMPRIVEKAFREEWASQAAPPQPPRRAN